MMLKHIFNASIIIKFIEYLIQGWPLLWLQLFSNVSLDTSNPYLFNMSKKSLERGPLGMATIFVEFLLPTVLSDGFPLVDFMGNVLT